MRKNLPPFFRDYFCHIGGLLLVMICLVPGQVFAQISVSGTVTSQETGETLPGVNILVRDSGSGTVTDMDGNFSLSVPDENGILIFSFIGFLPQEVQVNGRSIIDVA